MPEGGDPNKGGFDIVPALRLLWKRRWVLAAFAFAGLLLGGLFTFGVAKPLYQAHAIVSFRDPQNGAAGILAQQFGGLASAAGIDLSTGNSPGSEEFAVLSSKNVIKTLIVREKMIPILFPDNSRFFGLVEGTPPTVESAAKHVIDNLRSVEQDRRTGLITVAMRSRDPQLAARWTTALIDLTNEMLRARASDEASKNIAFLQREGQNTAVESVRMALVRLTENNLNQAMLAKVQTDFAFKMVDPPEVPERRDYIYPDHKVFLAVGLALGLLLGICILLWLNRALLFAVGQRPSAGGHGQV